MEFKDTAEEAAFRTEIHAFIKGNLPGRFAEPDAETAYGVDSP